MRRQIVVGVVLLLGWMAVPGLQAEEVPAAAAPAFLSPSPAPAPLSPAVPAPGPGALFLARPGGGGPTSCEVSPLCTNPPPDCSTVCRNNGFDGGACTTTGCCLCYIITP